MTLDHGVSYLVGRPEKLMPKRNKKEKLLNYRSNASLYWHLPLFKDEYILETKLDEPWWSENGKST